MATELGRVQAGLLAALDLSGVADGTELHGFRNWQCYRSTGPVTGIYEIRSGEIHSVVSGTLAYALALWGDPSVAWPGQCVRAEVTSPNWNGLLPGLSADGELSHDSDIRGLWWNSWEFTTRSAFGDYGEGFVITSGTTPGQPLTANTWYGILLAAIQQPTQTHPRGGMVFQSSQLALGEGGTGIGGGFNTGANSYPGLVFWNAAGIKWRNYRVYRDYRITVRSLSGTQAFRLFDSGGSPIRDSVAQSGGEAHVNIHLLAWPFTGHIQVYTDTTWTTPTAIGRYPTAGNASDLVGGDIFDQVTVGTRPGILINWEDDLPATFPDEWTLHDDKDVTADVVSLKIVQVAADPRIEVDTCLLTLRDPTGKYVPARIESPLYPNVRLNREGRVVLTRNGTDVCRFYGHVKEYGPSFPHKTDVDRMQHCTIRLESPMRDLVEAKVTLVTPPSGVLVNDDGVSGAIPELLALIPDIIPPASWALEPTPVSITASLLTSGMSLQSALEQCAILSDSVYYIQPHYKTASDQPNFFFHWKPRTTTHAVVDHSWVDTNDDISHLTPRFTGDDI